jgi:hypothetical protein
MRDRPCPWSMSASLAPPPSTRLSQLTFARFRRDDLLELPWWDQAFVRTLCNVEAALLSPQDLASADRHVADVSRLFAFLRER